MIRSAGARLVTRGTGTRVLWLAFGVGLAVVIYVDRHAVLHGLLGLADLRPLYLASAALAQVCGIVALAELQRTLLIAGGAGLTRRVTVPGAYLNNFFTLVVPIVGSGIAVRRQVRVAGERGADRVVAATAYALSTALATVALGVLAVLGAVLSDDAAVGVSGAIGAMVLLVAGSVVAVLSRTPRGRRRLRHGAVAALGVAHRRLGRPAIAPDRFVQQLRQRLSGLSLSRRRIAVCVVLALLNAGGNVACLALCVRAANAAVPWSHVLLVWTIEQGVVALSPVPAGIGVADVALVGALAAAGVPNVQAVRAAFAFRLVSFQFVATAAAMIISRGAGRPSRRGAAQRRGGTRRAAQPRPWEGT